MRNIEFNAKAYRQFMEWQETDAKIFRKLMELIKEAARDPFSGVGKPEPLKGRLRGSWSRRITQEHRLVYKIEEEAIVIASCFGHYDD